MVQCLPSLDQVEQFCDVCVLTKQMRLPFHKQSSFRAKERLKLIHGDLCGPVTLATPRGRCYFLLLVDDLSHYKWMVILDSKGEAANAIRCTHAATEVECGCKLYVLRTDNGDEFTTAEFTSYYADEGAPCHYSTSYIPQQNGIIERHN
jgi:transposase InsO family protein